MGLWGLLCGSAPARDLGLSAAGVLVDECKWVKFDPWMQEALASPALDGGHTPQCRQAVGRKRAQGMPRTFELVDLGGQVQDLRSDLDDPKLHALRPTLSAPPTSPEPGLLLICRIANVLASCAGSRTSFALIRTTATTSVTPSARGSTGIPVAGALTRPSSTGSTWKATATSQNG